MKLNKHLLNIAALLPLLAATSGSAAATQYTTGSASVSNIRVTLVDLDLNDGISPYLSYRENAAVTEPQSWTYVLHSADVLHSTSYVTHEAINRSASPFGALPVSKVLSAPLNLTAGTASGQADFSGTSLETLALGAQSAIDGTYGQERGVSVGAHVRPRDFYLSPNTALSITVDLSVASAMEGGIYLDDSQSRAWFILSSGSDYSYGEASHAAYSDPVNPTDGTAGTTTFTAGLSSGATERLVSIELAAVVESSITPVPEPQTWAMMLGGLGLIGAMARRRNRTA